MISSLIAVFLLAVCVQGIHVRHQTGVNLVEVAGTQAEKNISNVEITYYGAGDNCPPGGAIAYPKLHQLAGGTGDYSNPITFAGTTSAMSAGTIIYISALKKYFILEDDCQECDDDWSSSKKWHTDLWIGPLTAQKGITDCEVALSNAVGSASITVNAVAGKPVDTTPLWGTSCSVKVTDPCVDDGNVCGNKCQVPAATNCASAATMFGVTLARFQQLNPKISCSSSKTIKSGQTVCQSGSCGGP